MQHSNDTTLPDNSAAFDLDPVVTALRTQETFDRAQVAWLMAQAMRWGYEARVDEENAAWPETELVFNAGETVKAIDRKQLRNAIDAAATLPRPGDYHGGPVVWDTPSQQLPVAA